LVSPNSSYITLCDSSDICKLLLKYQVAIEEQTVGSSAGFTYRLDRLKPKSLKFRGPPVTVTGA
jgi:hypothetical protein